MSHAQTLARPIVLQGIGLHTGAPARVEIRPAAARNGRVFHRDGVEVPALADFVADTRRCTALGRHSTTISTVEHLLAALLLANIDDADIFVDGPELPALDGAAGAWYQACQAAGVRAQGAEVCTVRIPRLDWFAAHGDDLFLSPADGLEVYAAIAIPETPAARMIAGGDVGDPAVREQIVRARTYGIEREVQGLLAAGLAQGGSLDNAVVLTREGYLNAHVWPDEPAWHKALDLLGDLALTGARIAGRILAVRSGHRSHVALAKYLRQEWLAIS